MPRPNEYANNMGSVGAWPPASRAEILTQAQGLISQNYDRSQAQGGQIALDGVVYYMLVPLRAGDVVSNISVLVSTAAVAPTLSKVGLYSRTGVQLAVSADQGASWASTGTKTIAVTTPYVVPFDDAYYVAVVAKATTTLPTFQKCSTSASTATIIGSGARTSGDQTGQTDLPSPGVIGNTAPIAIWVGVS